MISKTKRRTAALILAFAMVLAFLPPVTLPASAFSPPTEQAVTDSLPHGSGKFYLTKDVTIDQEWDLTGQEVVLDLNGFGIRFVGNQGRVISINYGQLTIKDSNPDNRTHKYTVDENGLATVNDELTGIEGVDYFTFSGGYLTGGNEPTMGGGVLIHSHGTFLMEGGTIIGNHGNIGGGIAVESGSFTMNGGSILYNTTGEGGGVDVWKGTIAINGGLIQGNSAELGGGIFLGLDSVLDMTGGSVLGNVAYQGGGIYVKNASLRLEGAPTITDNKESGEDSNVYLYSDSAVVTVTGALENPTPVGVRRRNDVGVFTSGLSGKGNAERFSADDSRFTVGITEDGEAQLFVNVIVNPPAEPELDPPAEPAGDDSPEIEPVAEDPSEQATNEETPAPRSGKGGIIALSVGLGVTFAGAGVAGGIVFYRKKKNAGNQ